MGPRVCQGCYQFYLSNYKVESFHDSCTKRCNSKILNTRCKNCILIKCREVGCGLAENPSVKNFCLICQKKKENGIKYGVQSCRDCKNLFKSRKSKNINCQCNKCADCIVKLFFEYIKFMRILYEYTYG